MRRMDGCRSAALAILAAGTLVLGSAEGRGAPISLSGPYLSFTLNAQPGLGRIAFDGGASPLVGNGLGVLAFQGVATTRNGDELTLIEDGSLSFTTGAFQGNARDGREWDFAAGGAITITGGISRLGIPTGSTLMTGSFNDQVLVNGVGDGGLMVQAGAFFNAVNPVLAAHLGLPTDGTPYHGGIATLFAADGLSPGAFSSEGYTSGQVTTAPVPEPGATLVFLVAFVGGLGWMRRR